MPDQRWTCHFWVRILYNGGLFSTLQLRMVWLNSCIRVYEIGSEFPEFRIRITDPDPDPDVLNTQTVCPPKQERLTKVQQSYFGLAYK